MDAVLRHGCEAAFVSLLVDFGANLNLVKWEALGPESRGRRKVDPTALQVFQEARKFPFTNLLLRGPAPSCRCLQPASLSLLQQHPSSRPTPFSFSFNLSFRSLYPPLP
nr:ankyrin repeat and SOCS box containing 1 [Rousettus aegyptiacus]